MGDNICKTRAPLKLEVKTVVKWWGRVSVTSNKGGQIKHARGIFLIIYIIFLNIIFIPEPKQFRILKLWE